MDSKRDPRKDPRPGDVLRDGAGVALIVRVTQCDVFWAVQDQVREDLHCLTKEVWVNLSQTDEVLHVAS